MAIDLNVVNPSIRIVKCPWCQAYALFFQTRPAFYPFPSSWSCHEGGTLFQNIMSRTDCVGDDPRKRDKSFTTHIRDKIDGDAELANNDFIQLNVIKERPIALHRE